MNQKISQSRILLVDDEPLVLRACQRILQELKEVETVSTDCSKTAAKLLRDENFDLAILDIFMPEMDGLDLLRDIRSHDPELSIVLITGSPTLETAVEGLRMGVSDYVIKPILPDDFLARVRRVLEEKRLKQENRLLTRQLNKEYAFGDIVTQSESMKPVLELVNRVSQTNVDALIIGEPGVGKELNARTIHKKSGRTGRFIPIHCSDIPESLLEREFFGFERGVFRDADFSSIGLLELCEEGTLFIDEVQAMPLAMQSKLVTVLQERTFRRIGANKDISFNAKVIIAAHEDLHGPVQAGLFREELYSWVNAGAINVPALRDRSEDIALLSAHFLQVMCQEMNRVVPGLTPEVMEVFEGYAWPGNVRELQNTIKRTLVACNEKTITLDNLPDIVVKHSRLKSADNLEGLFELRQKCLAAFEQKYLNGILKSNSGNVLNSAKKAGVPRGTFYRLMKKYDINPANFRTRDS
jgi:DNA-binding NtrC family response regulator